MASIIKLKRSSTTGAVPSLQTGEVAVNLFDRKIYVGNGAGSTAIGGEDFRLTTQASGSEGAYLKLLGESVLSTNTVLLSAGEGININRLANGTITFAGEDASSSNKGVASFSDTNFTVSSGDVSLSTDISVSGQLNVGENVVVTGNGSVGGTFTSTGQATFSSGIDVDGTAALNAITCTTLGANGNVTIGGTLTTTGLTTLNGGITADSGAFTVADTTGNIHTNGTLDVDGNSTLNGTLSVDGSSALNAVTATTIQANGAITGSSTLTVTGLTTLNGGITADSGAFTVADTSGNIGTTGTLTVTGLTSLNGGIAVDSNAFTVAGDGSGDTVIAGQLNVGENVVVTGNTAIGGSLTVDGNLTVEGALTYISSSTVYTDDGMFKLSSNNAADSVDSGIYAKYIDGATSKYAGYFRDATDGVFKFYKELQSEPASTVDVNGTGYALAQVDMIIDGGTY